MELCDANLRDDIDATWDEERQVKMPWFANVKAFGSPCERFAGLEHYDRYFRRDCLHTFEEIYPPRHQAEKWYPSFVAHHFSLVALYSCRDKCWKVANFGLTVPESASTGFITVFQRGTPRYRAPKLIFERESAYRTNKCDIWFMGIIFYELIQKTTPFENDNAVREYYANPCNMPVSFEIDASTLFHNEKSKTFVSSAINQMRSEMPSDRPTAQELYKSFKVAFQYSPRNSLC